MKNNWWKILGAILVIYTIPAGFLFPVPKQGILNETIRNLYFHVPIWFAMLALMSVSVVASIMSLNKSDLTKDLWASKSAAVGVVFSVLGILTGSLWAKYTWGTWWNIKDPKLNGVAIAVLAYVAYFILRDSVSDEQKKARLAAIYNIFAYVMLIIFVMVLPRIMDSMHPGNGGNPAFGKYDLDNTMRLVFYPACLGWILISFWILQVVVRVQKIKNKLND